MNICKKCGKEFEPSKGLINYCSLNCRNGHNIEYEQKHEKEASCVICNRRIIINKRASLKTAKCNECLLELKIKNKKPKKIRVYTNEYLEALSNRTKKQMESPAAREYIRQKNIEYNKNPEVIERKRELGRNKIVSKETRKKLSDAAKKRNFGGHTSKNKIYYKSVNGDDIYLQSNYELCVAKDLDRNNIKWSRPAPFNWTDINGNTHKYYPDFFLIDYNVYLDPKNDYLIIKDKIKIDSVQQQNDIIVLVLNSNELFWEIIKNKINLI